MPLRLAVITVVVISMFAIPAFAAPFPGASGMAVLDATHFLCVQDVKAEVPGPRIGVLKVNPDAKSSHGQKLLDYTPLEIGNWHGERASDLESICPLPGTEHGYLACESGYWQGRYGRLFELRAAHGAHGWSVKLVHTLQLPALDDQIEGIACDTDAAGRVMLILGERGGASEGANGQLVWGWLDDLQAAQHVGRKPENWDHDSLEIPNPFDSYPQARSISDLYLDSDGTLWASSAYDPDRDCGPFASCVWPIATVNPISETAVNRIGNDDERRWLMEGLKIEAVCAPCTPGALLSVATDDEDYGGVWRPLGKPTNIPQDDTDTSTPPAESGDTTAPPAPAEGDGGAPPAPTDAPTAAPPAPAPAK